MADDYTYDSDRHVYPANAKFSDSATGQLMVELRPDAHSVIGPRLATQEDIERYPGAYSRYQGEGGSPPPTSGITPTLTSLTPASMPSDGAATSVRIEGTGFADGRSVVVWDDKDAASIFESDTVLVCEMTGPDVEGISTVAVRNDDLISNELEFEFTAATP